MKKITFLFLALTAMLNVANAQDVTVFNFDGVTPSFDSWSDSFVSVANPVPDGVNASANVGKYTHNNQYSEITTTLTTPIDSRFYTSFQFKVYSPAAGNLIIGCRNAAGTSLSEYNTVQSVTAGWTTITQDIVSNQPIAKIAFSFKLGTVPAGDATDVIYLDDLKIIKTTNPIINLYAENFSADIASWTGWSGEPLTKAGKWKGGIDLETTANATMTIFRNWGNPSANVHELDMTPAAATVTIPNINIAGFDNLKLNFDNVAYSGDFAPVVEYKSGSGNWTPITTAVATGTWATQTITLPTLVDTDPLSLRFSSDATLGYRIDNLKVTGTSKVLGTESNELSDNSIKVYPNPFVNEFNVEKSEGPLQVSVFDISGKKVATAKSSSNQLSMGSSLKSGVYVVKVEGANAKDSKSFKIIKK